MSAEQKMNIIGKNIKKIRQSKDMTQEVLAAKCNLIGFDITRSAIAKIESKGRRVTDIEVQIFKQVLNVQYDELFMSGHV